MRSQVKTKQQRTARTRLQRKRHLFFLIFLAGAAVALLLGWSIVQFSINASATQTNKKQAMLQHMQQMRVTALTATKPPKNPHWTPSSPGTPEAWATGIIETSQAPFPADSYTIVNQWQEVVDGKHLMVYAGSEGQDASQGLVIVMTWSLDLHTVTGPHVYMTHSHNGSLRITGASAQHLTLTSTSGATFTFFVVPACAMNQPAITGSECQLL